MRIALPSGTRALRGGVTVFCLTMFWFAGPAQAVKRRAFVTSIAGSGNISTWPGATGATALDRADSVCRALAAAADTPLPNASTYRAWLSTSTTDAYCHVQGLTGKKATGCGGGALPGGGPWFLANGITNFTGDLDELVDEGVIYRPVQRDENFDPIPTTLAERSYWTGTLVDGTADAQNCGNWLSTSGNGRIGEAWATVGRWTESIGPDCSASRRLLCLEPGAGERTTLHWSPGAIVFVTSEIGSGAMNDWPESDGINGLAGADRICRNVALAGHLPVPDSFVAWLSTAAVDASARLTTNGPFRRIDAFTIANNLSDLTDGTIATTIHVQEDGTYLLDNNGTWTGTLGDGTFHPDRCLDWTSMVGSDDGLTGLETYAGLDDWTDNFIANCSDVYRLYCFSNIITIFWDGFEITGDASRWSNIQP
ncbi:MAG: hypothetical protein AB7G12_00865 [Thermoanaerobaculia bacterium]